MESIQLNETYRFLKGGALSPLVLDQVFDRPNPSWRRPAVIVVPGGGYGTVSPREGAVVAAHFLAKGFQTFVFTYLTAKDGVAYPEQRNELGCAVDYLKKHAGEYHLNPNEIFVVGFSAGGHLAGDVAMEREELEKEFGIDPRIKGLGLGYPVISSEEGEPGTFANLLKGYSEEEVSSLSHKLSLEKHVGKDNPPAYVFATGDDNYVPSSNAVRYALALYRNRIPCELHVFPHGAHGLSTGDKETCPSSDYEDPTGRARYWSDECASFFRMLSEEAF